MDFGKLWGQVQYYTCTLEGRTLGESEAMAFSAVTDNGLVSCLI